jgi:hypothetical protein
VFCNKGCFAYERAHEWAEPDRICEQCLLKNFRPSKELEETVESSDAYPIDASQETFEVVGKQIFSSGFGIVMKEKGIQKIILKDLEIVATKDGIHFFGPAPPPKSEAKTCQLIIEDCVIHSKENGIYAAGELDIVMRNCFILGEGVGAMFRGRGKVTMENVFIYSREGNGLQIGGRVETTLIDCHVHASESVVGLGECSISVRGGIFSSRGNAKGAIKMFGGLLGIDDAKHNTFHMQNAASCKIENAIVIGKQTKSQRGKLEVVTVAPAAPEEDKTETKE